jgi:hypothetical protein
MEMAGGFAGRYDPAHVVNALVKLMRNTIFFLRT